MVVSAIVAAIGYGAAEAGVAATIGGAIAGGLGLDVLDANLLPRTDHPAAACFLAFSPQPYVLLHSDLPQAHL